MRNGAWTEMALDLFNESSNSGTRVTLQLLHPEAYCCSCYVACGSIHHARCS